MSPFATIRQGYRLRVYPTRAQKILLCQYLGCKPQKQGIYWEEYVPHAYLRHRESGGTDRHPYFEAAIKTNRRNAEAIEQRRQQPNRTPS